MAENASGLMLSYVPFASNARRKQNSAVRSACVVYYAVFQERLEVVKQSQKDITEVVHAVTFDTL